MPKKRNFNFRNLEGSSSGKASASKDGTNKASTVNERLRELRCLEGKDAAKKKAELAQLSQSQRSVLPPEIQRVLGVPESAPPKPKRGARLRMPNPTPGPAAPGSWAKTPRWPRIMDPRTGTHGLRKTAAADQERTRPKELMRFARLLEEQDSDSDVGPSSLQHIALKAAAGSWDLFDARDLPMLGDLPLRLRVKLISYLGFYGPAINGNVLDALTNDQEPVRSLDLAGLIGHGALSIATLNNIAGQTSVKETGSVSDTIADSWDQDESSEAARALSLPATRFSYLSHLSLSHPPPNVGWKDLLSLSKRIPAVTHMSLAYWPRPTLTPHLATATVSGQNSPDVNAGGSQFYSAMDEDFHEPASILRALSSSLLRLTWLDLEGCTEWMPALAYHQDASSMPQQHDLQENDAWTAASAVTSIFITNWANLTYINCAQGWLPSAAVMQLLPKQTMPYMHRQIVAQFEDTSHVLHSMASGIEGMTLASQRKAESWVHFEDRAFAAERRINAIRRTSNIKPVDFDHGWDKDKSPVLRRSM